MRFETAYRQNMTVPRQTVEFFNVGCLLKCVIILGSLSLLLNMIEVNKVYIFHPYLTSVIHDDISGFEKMPFEKVR